MSKLTHEEAVNALLRIRTECGAVCSNYELCDHDSCASSYGAWAIADEALFGKKNDSSKN